MRSSVPQKKALSTLRHIHQPLIRSSWRLPSLSASLASRTRWEQEWPFSWTKYSGLVTCRTVLNKRRVSGFTGTRGQSEYETFYAGQIAGATRHRRCQFRYRGSRRESAVVWLSVLGGLRYVTRKKGHETDYG